MNKRFILAVFAVIIIVAILIIVVVGRQKKQSQKKIEVTASFYPLAEFVHQVGGDKVKVTNITPLGAEPHDFEPSPQDIIKIERSKIFIYTGTGLEPWADRVVPTLEGVTVINASKGIPLLPAIPQEGQKSNPNGVDPHFYLDPVLDQKIVNNIAKNLIKVDPANKAYYEKNAKSYEKKLADLDKEYRKGLSKITTKDIITSHAAFAYLAKRYGLVQIPISGLAGQEPSAKRLAQIAKLAKERHIKYIFFEKLVSPRLSDTIAREVGLKTLVLDPIEGLTPEEQKQGKDFISLMRQNLANLQLALGAKNKP
jgi:zinc transport system substrate-binding protein